MTNMRTTWAEHAKPKLGAEIDNFIHEKVSNYIKDKLGKPAESMPRWIEKLSEKLQVNVNQKFATSRASKVSLEQLQVISGETWDKWIHETSSNQQLSPLSVIDKKNLKEVESKTLQLH